MTRAMMMRYVVLLPLTIGVLPCAAVEASRSVVDTLRCEYRRDPEGIDVTRPRLSWVVRSDGRGVRQAAYRVIVASAPDLLDRENGDLWDSGKVDSGQSAQIDYAGKPLASAARCWWKVRAWTSAGNGMPADAAPTAWSGTGRWTMGLLRAEDWHANWISDPILADPANRPRAAIHCYRSELASHADAAKWVTLDLGSVQRIDSIDLSPARPEGLNPDFPTFLYPVRFKVEASVRNDFSDATEVVDQTGQDVVAPRPPPMPVPVFRFDAVQARYVRLTVTRLARWDRQDFGIALGQIEVFDGKTNVAPGAAIECSDSTEDQGWSKRYLDDGKPAVVLAPTPPAIEANVPGVPAARAVSRTPLLRREFTLDGDVRRATLYTSARGFYEARVNGRRVGDALLSPGYTEYDHRISYQAFEVTDRVRKGRNAIGAMLGYGWYASHMNLAENRYIYGYFPQFLAQLDVELDDGRRVTIGSDDQWRSTLAGPVLYADLLDGEAYDARREIPGWDSAGFDDGEWGKAWSQPRDDVKLVWDQCQPVRRAGEMRPVSVKQVKPGVYVFDLGQNLAGWCRVDLDGPAGTQVTLRHAEAAKDDGDIDARNLWGVAQQDDYILDGKGPRTFEPHFTYHGFRYVQVSGLPQPPRPDTLVAIPIHTDVATIGEFQCSNDMFNRLMTAARWTQHNMLFDVPAGCAARSERLSWTGDIRPCVQTAMFDMDTAAFFSKYLTDLRDAQTPDGAFCDITPHAHLRGTTIAVGSPGWADAGVSVPWDLYVNLGDRRALAEHFDAARRWVDYIHAANPDGTWSNRRGMDWGDWLSAGGPATPKDVGAAAFYAHSADLVSRMAAALGRQHESAEYRKLFAAVKRAFNARYVSKDGVVQGDSQGGYALALQFDLLDEPAKSMAVARLLQAVDRNGGHPTTGFWSSDALVESLSQNGHNDAASAMVDLRTMPSWGYMVESGGTTLWESFDAYVKGRATNLSLNHWTHSAIGEWLWRNVAGLNPDPDHPGYQSFTVRPRPTKEVNWCKAAYDSIRGPIAIDWRRDDTGFRMRLTVPVGATARAYVPTTDAASVREGETPADIAEGVKLLRIEAGVPVYEVNSGSYAFSAK